MMPAGNALPVHAWLPIRRDRDAEDNQDNQDILYMDF